MKILRITEQGLPIIQKDLDIYFLYAATCLRNQFNKESLVWKAGMAQWSKAGEVEELVTVFQAMPPIPGADGSGMPQIPQ